MDIIIASPGFNAGASLEDFTKRQLDRLNNDRTIRANVTLYLGPSGNPDRNYCEIRLEIPGNDLFVKKQSEHFETAISACVDVLAKLQKEEKKKAVHQRQANEDIIQDELMKGEDESSDDVELEDIVK